MALIQSEDSRAAFCFMGDFNCHNEEWLGFRRTNSHGRPARDFSDMADSRQMVVGPTHRDGGVLDLVFTDVPDLCEVVIGCRLGRSDHCYLSVKLSTALRIPDFCVSHVVYQKSRKALSGEALWKFLDPVSLLCLISVIDARVPKVMIRIRSRDELWFDDSCRIAFDRKQTAYYAWCRLQSAANWDNYTHLQREANQCYERAQRSYNERKKEILQNAAN